MSTGNTLQLDASPETYTACRDCAETETPKVLEAQRAEARDRGQHDPSRRGDLVQSESGSKVYANAWGKEDEFILPAIDDPDKTTLQAAWADYLSGLGHALGAIALCVPLGASAVEELAGGVLSRHVLRSPAGILSPAPTQADRRYDRFRRKLVATLLDEPIEDGITHAAESVIDESLRANSFECRDWLSRVLVEYHPTRPCISASIVRCIGRLDYDRVGAWGMHVADDALRHRDVEVREAAVRALEAWGGRGAVEMLGRHQDSEAWLDEYVRQVIVDLSGTTS